MKKTVCALGFFDGVHKAHMHILSQCAAYGKENSLISAAVTFDKSPAEYFGGKVEYLTTFAQKEEIIRALGMDRVIALPADESILSLSPEEFVDKVMVNGLHTSAIFCGFNYSFGKNAQGSAEDLKRLCASRGIEVFISGEMEQDGVTVSSSEIRRALKSGDVERASKLLTRPFEIRGTVEYGKHLGRRLGFPTANIYPSSSLPKLPYGVYITKTIVNGTEYPSVTNVGVNPTVGDKSLRIETNIIGFEDTLYGSEIKVRFYKYTRGEMKFGSVELLREQISRDKKSARDYFKNL